MQYELKITDDVKSSPKRFFSHVRRNRRLKQLLVTLRPVDGAFVTDSPNMARILANYYASVYRTGEGRDHSLLPDPSKGMNAPHFTPAAIHKELSTLDTTKGAGPDQLHLFILQILANFLAESITALYKKSLRRGEIPQDWRKQLPARFSKRWTRRTRPTTAL